MTNYNDGNIHGWNGGDFPVHPKTRVKIWFRHGGHGENQADCYTWRHSDLSGLDIIAFQVTKEYKGPEVYTGECWAYHYSEYQSPSLSHVEPYGPGAGKGKYTATHQEGKLMKIIWERNPDNSNNKYSS